MKVTKKLRKIGVLALIMAISLNNIPIGNVYAESELGSDTVIEDDYTVSGGDLQPESVEESIEETDVEEETTEEITEETVVEEETTISEEKTEEIIEETVEETEIIHQELSKNVANKEVSISGKIPEGAEIEVIELVNYEDIANQIKTYLGGGSKVKVYAGFDMKIMSNGEKYQPVEHGESVSVTINNIGEITVGQNEQLVILHIAENGNIEQVSGSVTGTTLQFSANSFSDYVVAGIENEVTPIADTITVNGEVFDLTGATELSNEYGSGYILADGQTLIVTDCKNTSISNYPWYSSMSNIQKLKIAETVTLIGNTAFYNYTGLTGELVIPASVTKIGQYAFYGCSGLTGGLVIPASVTTIDKYAFEGCSGFNGELVISNPSTSIRESAFNGCSGFTGELVIPSSVTSIDTYAFCGCSGFTKLVISSTVSVIGEGAFDGCFGFRGELELPTSVVTIKSAAFAGCSGFTGELVLPASLATIEASAFNQCNGITKISGGDNIQSIGNRAFFVISPVYTERVFNNSLLINYDWNGDNREVVAYTVTFDADGGSPVPATRKVAHNNVIGEVEEPTKAGYEFDGWYKDGVFTFSNYWSCEGNSVQEDMTLVAKWKELPSYTVTFDAQGGAPVPAAQVISVGGKVARPSDPEKSGFIFNGWKYYAYSTFELDAWDFENDTVTDNVTLYADWKSGTHAVTFSSKAFIKGHENCDKCLNGNNYVSICVDNTYINSSEDIIKREANTSVDWHQDNYFKVKDSGKIGNPDDYTSGMWTAKIEGKEYEGFTLLGWSTEKYADETQLFDFENEIITENITLYPVVKLHETIIYINTNNGGEVYELPEKVEFGHSLPDLTEPTRNGSNFIGWTVVSGRKDTELHGMEYEKEILDLDNEEYYPISTRICCNSIGGAVSGMIDVSDKVHELTLIARYDYKFVLDYNDGITPNEEHIIAFNEPWLKLTVPTREGYKFISWHKADGMDIPAGRFEIVYSEIQEMVDELGEDIAEVYEPTMGKIGEYIRDANIDYDKEATVWVAQWEEINNPGNNTPEQYTIVFDAQGGIPEPETQFVVMDGKIIKPQDPEKEGAVFLGWYTSNDVEWDFENDIVTGSTTLTAKWRELKTYKVYFDAEGGTPEPEEQAVIEGGKVTMPANPTLEGHVFVGWNDQYGNAWNFENYTLPYDMVVEGDLYLTAEYKRVFEVVFDTDGGTPIPSTQNIIDGFKAVEPIEPTKEGFEFIGWYNGNTKWNFNTDKVTSEITLVAKWEEIIVEHVHTFSDEWSANDNIHWHDATCGHDLKKDEASHIASDWIIDEEATEEAEGSKHKECTVCERILETAVIPMLESEHVHTFSDEWSTDESHHWHDANCGHDIKADEGEHVASDWIVDSEPTEELEGSKHKECTVCEKVLESEVIPKLPKEEVKEEPKEEHVHTFSDNWSHNAENHWHDSTCGHDVIADNSNHTESDWIVDKQATTQEDGKKHTECLVCGRIIKTEIIPMIVPEITPVEPTPEPEPTPETTPEPIDEPETITEPTTEPEQVPVIEEEEPLYIGTINDDSENRTGAMARFVEAVKTMAIVVSISLAIILGIIGLLLLLLAFLRRVVVQNDRNTDEYNDSKYETVYKTFISSEGNKVAQLFRKNDRVWMITIPEKVIADRVTDDFKVVLKKGFCNWYHGEQLIVVLDSENEEDIKELGFVIDKEENEITFNVGQTK